MVEPNQVCEMGRQCEIMLPPVLPRPRPKEPSRQGATLVAAAALLALRSRPGGVRR